MAFCSPPHRLAALEACGPGLKELTLHGAVPLNGAVADAMRVRCPQLARFTLNHEYERSDVLPVAGGPAPPEYHSGCVQLLTLCGPRLRELRLLDVQRWQTMSYMALQWCTALTSLELQAGWREPDDYNWVSPAYSCNGGRQQSVACRREIKYDSVRLQAMEKACLHLAT